MGDTHFSFHNQQTGDSPVNQQGQTVSGNVTTNVHKGGAYAPADVTKFFDEILRQDKEGPDEAWSPDEFPEELLQAAQAQAEKDPAYREVMGLDANSMDAAEYVPDETVLGLKRQAEAIESDGHDEEETKGLYAKLKGNITHYGPMIGRAALAFGEGWLKTALARNPIVAGTLAMIGELRSSSAPADPYNNAL